MLSPPIYSIMAQTCVACSYYWGTVIYQPHRLILMWRRRDCRSCMPSIIREVRIEIKDLLMIVKGIKRVASSAIYFAYPNKRAKLCPQKPDHHGLLRRHVFFIIAWYRHATKIHVRYS